ncbi:hypothetical protein B0H11DRAFT_1814058 [Mycena galericulata]|nr:hypothetical protein B0H11DRAFT_1814058 [Mycena galericulata]
MPLYAHERHTASRSRERVTVLREDAPALPSSSTPSSASGSAHGHGNDARNNDGMSRSRSVPGGIPTYVDERTNTMAASSSQATASAPNLHSQHTGNSSGGLPAGSTGPHPTNAHIPLAMQARPRNASDSRAILATAAARAPGSPPSHTLTLAQDGQGQYAYRDAAPSQHGRAPSQSPKNAQSGYASARPRTPEAGVVRRPSAGTLERQGSHRAGGLEREGSFRTPELALDVKRLLAKPVSVSGARGRADSSDGGSTGGEGLHEAGTHLRRKRYDTAGRLVGRVEEDREESRGTRSEDDAAQRKEERAQQREQDKKVREVARALVGPLGGEEKEKRQKNVLKRRPSASRPSTAPSATAPAPVTVSPVAARAGPPVLHLNLSLNPMGMPFPERGTPPAGSPGGSGNGSGQLTPAGAVVQAYKRANSPGASPIPSPSSGIFKDKPRNDGLLARKTEPPSPPVTPYYTVFGSTSGRVVAVGGPEDAWDGAGSYISASAFPGLDGPRSAKSSTSGSTGRTLTRKVSERWVRKREESEDDSRGRGSSQIDRRGKKGVRSRSRPPVEETQSPIGDPDSGWPSSSTLSHSREDGVFANEPRSRRSEPALGGGSKIWKLMKRISTGGLKEKYDRGPRSLPPIPPLPPMPDLPPVPQLRKDYPSLEARTAMSSDGHSSEEPGALSRFMQSRTSLSGSHPTPPTSGIPRPAARTLPMPPPIPASHQPRPSTTTRSSSPVSSDVASSKFFHRTTSSTRSSTSSLGDEAPPPMPDIIGKHIVPPKDLYKLDFDETGPNPPEDTKGLVKPKAFFGTQKIRMPDDWTIVNTPAEEHPPSLPLPPRRLPVPVSARDASRLSVNRLSQTPSIPEFSTVAPINTFAPRKPVVMREKPRVESLLASLAPAQSRHSTISHDDKSSQHIMSQTSTISNSSARQKRVQQRSTSLPRVAPEPLTFRDMSEKAALALTEKEKAARWDDLLERSERAGGTIHLGTSDQLASDNVSLRNSTASTQLLKDF